MPAASRIEMLGYISEDIFEYCFESKGDGLAVKKGVTPPYDFKRMGHFREEWANGHHVGDCTSIPCPCCACYFADLLSTGDRLALALELGGRCNDVAKALNEGEVPNEKWVYQWAELFISEADRLGLRDCPKKPVKE